MQTGRDRLWDVCSRTTRDASAVKSDVDGVSISLYCLSNDGRVLSRSLVFYYHLMMILFL